MRTIAKNLACYTLGRQRKKLVQTVGIWQWSMLVSEFGGLDKAGEALKSKKDWKDDGNGTNSSGFNALPGGQRTPYGNYRVLGFLGFWWSF